MGRLSKVNSRGISPAWISFADLFSQLMVIGLVIGVGFLYLAAEAKNRADEVEGKLEAIKEGFFTVSGNVIGLKEGEWKNGQLIGKERNISLMAGGAFKISKLEKGEHRFVLEFPNRNNSEILFDVGPEGFRGLKIIPGDITREAKESSRSNTLAIRPMTEDIVAFETANHRLLPPGQKFLTAEFQRKDPSGRSPLARLQNDRTVKIAVIGQADPRPLQGRDYSNLGLSALRASAVGDYLVQVLGINPEQIIVLGLGAAKRWLPTRGKGETMEDYFSRCRRILIMYTKNADQALLQKVKAID